MKLEFEFVPLVDDLRHQIHQCENAAPRHVQQVIYSTYHDGMTQVCFGCMKVRSTINMALDEDDESTSPTGS